MRIRWVVLKLGGRALKSHNFLLRPLRHALRPLACGVLQCRQRVWRSHGRVRLARRPERTDDLACHDLRQESRCGRRNAAEGPVVTSKPGKTVRRSGRGELT